MWGALVLSSLLAAPVAAQESAGAPASGVGPTQVPPSGLADAPRPVSEPPVNAPPAPLSQPSAQPTLPPTPAPGTPVPLSPPLPPSTLPAAPAPASTEHVHLGLFFHLDIGGAYLRTSGSRSGSTFVGQGGALGGAIAVGWAPNDEWAIGLEIWNWKALSQSALGQNTTVELEALGLNLTRYIVPIDLFATVVVAGTRLAITDDSDVEYRSSDIGFGLKVLLGKEWRVTSWLGLGLAAELYLSVNRNDGQTLRTVGAGLVFSCTLR